MQEGLAGSIGLIDLSNGIAGRATAFPHPSYANRVGGRHERAQRVVSAVQVHAGAVRDDSADVVPLMYSIRAHKPE